MVLMNRNQRQGAVAEMRVALSLVEHGCAVNSLTQMDFGTDLHVQVPQRIPAADAEEWEMTQRSVSLQIKSSRSATERAVIPFRVAAEWVDHRRRADPTFVVLVVGDDFYLFDTSRIRHLVERSVARDRKKTLGGEDWDDSWGPVPMSPDLSITFSSNTGLRAALDDLPRLIVHWAVNAAELDRLSRAGIDLSLGIGKVDVPATMAFATLAVASYATTFFDYEDYKHSASGGADQTFELAQDMLSEAFSESGARLGAQATEIVSAIPIIASGWGATLPLSAFVSATDRGLARDELIELVQRLRYSPVG